ncbi:MAG: hypothetical protein ABL888_22035 [Pirellulaceae bacterium]
MMQKSKIRLAFEVAGVTSFLLLTSGCCNGRFAIVRNQRTQCTCSHIKDAKVQLAKNDTAIDTHSGYFTDSGYQQKLIRAEAPPAANSNQASRQKTDRDDTDPTKIAAESIETPASTDPVNANENSAVSSDKAEPVAAITTNVTPPQEIQAAPIDEVAAADQTADSKTDENLLVNDLRSFGEPQDGWKLPDANKGKTFELPAPATDVAEPELDDSVPGSIVGEINKNIVLRAKVVQPLIRPLPDDARYTQGRRLNPAKPAGYTRDELNNDAPVIQTPTHQIDELPPLRRPRPLIDPVSVEKKEKTASSTNNSTGGMVLKAVPQATEINFANLPQPAAPLVPNQAASPDATTRNR